MKFGMCGGMDRIAGTKKAGFDYIEPALNWFGAMTDEEFDRLLAELKKYDLPCESTNCFLPWDVKVTGGNVDYDRLDSFLDKAFERAYTAGVKVSVFGSGGPRSVPDGYPFDKAVREFVLFLDEHAAPRAARYGIDVAIEPLNRKETNLIRSVREGSIIASLCKSENVYCLADVYHMIVEGDDWEDLKLLGGMIRHAHLSNPCPPSETGKKRIFPKDPTEFDYAGFFEALRACGCERVSIEADLLGDFETDAIAAGKLVDQFR